LEFVSLQNVGCSVHACNALSELVPNGSALAGLHLYNNMTGDEGAEHVARLLSRCPGMADFKLASSRVGASGGISIAKALSVGEHDPSPHCLHLPCQWRTQLHMLADTRHAVWCCVNLVGLEHNSCVCNLR
jgi:hypothetical protein